MGSLVDQTCLRKESLNLKISYQKLSKQKRQKGKKTRGIKVQNIQEQQDNLKYCDINITGITKGEEKEKGAEEMFKPKSSEIFPQINVRHRTTNSGCSENTTWDKCKKKTKTLHLGISYPNSRKSKTKENFSKQSQTGGKDLIYIRAKIKITSSFSDIMCNGLSASVSPNFIC